MISATEAPSAARDKTLSSRRVSGISAALRKPKPRESSTKRFPWATSRIADTSRCGEPSLSTYPRAPASAARFRSPGLPAWARTRRPGAGPPAPRRSARGGMPTASAQSRSAAQTSGRRDRTRPGAARQDASYTTRSGSWRSHSASTDLTRHSSCTRSTPITFALRLPATDVLRLSACPLLAPPTTPGREEPAIGVRGGALTAPARVAAHHRGGMARERGVRRAARARRSPCAGGPQGEP